MSKKRTEKAHSRSALVATLYRAVAHKEFQDQGLGPDHLAEYFLPGHQRFLICSEKMRARGRARDRAQRPGVFEYMLARTAFFDEVFVEALSQSIPQIVLLGAGYDSRAHRFAGLNKTTWIIELDQAETQLRKMKRLKKFRLEIPARVSHAAVDFARESLQDVLAAAGFEENLKTLFLWEGVCMYLAPESVDAVLAFVARSAHPDSRLVFDYAVPVSAADGQEPHGVELCVQSLGRLGPDEALRTTIGREIDTFLAQRGLKLVRRLDPGQIEKAYLLKADGSSLGQPNGLFRLVVVSPQRAGR